MLGNKLKHSKQSDDSSCGLYTANTIRHAIIGETLVTHNTRLSLRMEYFCDLADAHIAGVRVRSSQPQTNYQSDNLFRYRHPMLAKHYTPQGCRVSHSEWSTSCYMTGMILCCTRQVICLGMTQVMYHSPLLPPATRRPTWSS